MNQKDVANTYPAIQVYSNSNAVGHGSRVVYWVGSDGVKCIVFNCVGDRFTVPLSELTIEEVINVSAYSLDGNRLRYRETPASAWTDAGPLTTSAKLPEDLSLRVIKQRAGKELSFDDLLAAETDTDDWGDDTW